MEHIEKRKAIRHENSSHCVVYEYPMENPEMNIGVAEIAHRYPDRGYAVNHQCCEMGYVLRGCSK